MGPSDEEIKASIKSAERTVAESEARVQAVVDNIEQPSEED